MNKEANEQLASMNFTSESTLPSDGDGETMDKSSYIKVIQELKRKLADAEQKLSIELDKAALEDERTTLMLNSLLETFRKLYGESQDKIADLGENIKQLQEENINLTLKMDEKDRDFAKLKAELKAEKEIAEANNFELSIDIQYIEAQNKILINPYFSN